MTSKKKNDCLDKHNLELLAKIKNGDNDARNQLVERNMGLVYNVASKFGYGKEVFEELCQEGVIGLINSIDGFDISKGNNFTGYACMVIRNKMIDWFYDNYRTVRIPRDKYTKYKIYKQEMEFLEQKLMRSVSFNEVASSMNCDLEDIDELELVFRYPVSLYELLYNGDECMISSFVDSPEEEFINKDIVSQVHMLIENSNLTERELEILKLHYGFYNNRVYSYQEIAQKMGCHRSNIGHINNKILTKLRKNCKL